MTSILNDICPHRARLGLRANAALIVLVCDVLSQSTYAQSADLHPAITNSIGQSLQFIPAGTYIRGGRSIRDGGFFKDHSGYVGSDENPLHPLRLSNPFYL